MLKKPIQIRLFQPKDAKRIIQLHYNAVHKIASKDYKPEILNDWSPPFSFERVKKFVENQSKGKEVTMVAEINRRIVGFGVIVPKENEVRAIYVSPQVKRKGIGSTLLRKLEELAKEKGIKKLRLESSVTAEKFYQKNGYKVIKR